MSQTTKSPALNRIEGLLDGSSFVEIGGYVTARSTDFNLAQQETPGDGVVTGYGTIGGSLVYVYSQNSAILGGSVGEMHAKKIVNLYSLAVKMGAPIIGLLDSSGLRLQEATDAMEAFGQIYHAQAMAAGVIPQIQAVFGSCGAGLAVSAALADFTFMEKKGKLFISAPNAVLGNHSDKLDTSGTDFQYKEAGNVDFVGSEAEILEGIRKLISILPANNEDDLSYDECSDDLNRRVEIAGIDGDTGLALAHISDNGFYLEMKKDYAVDMVTAFIRCNGITVGCVANRSRITGEKNTLSKNLTARGAKKAAEFITFCDAFSIPVLSLVDVSGYEASKCAEKHMAKAVAKLSYAYADATVPKITVIVGEALGSAYITMGSKSLGADLVYAWENARIGAIGADLAAQIIYAKEAEAAEDKAEFFAQKSAEYESLQNSALSAAKRGYIDDIILPQETRMRIIAALEMLFTKKEDRLAKKHGTV